MPVTAHVVFPSQAKLTFATTEVGIDHDVIAGLQFSSLYLSLTAARLRLRWRSAHYSPGAFREREDLPRPIRAVDVRQLQLQPGPAVTHHDVHAVEGRSMQTDQRFARFGFRSGEIGIFQHFRSAMFVKKDGFHRG